MSNAEQSHGAHECVACGAATWEAFFEARDLTGAVDGTFTYIRCGGCGLIRLEPLPSAGEAASFYPHDYAGYRIGGNRLAGAVQDLLYRRSARWIERHGAPSQARRVLEIGCAAGKFLRVLRRLGWDAVGLEPSKQAAEVGRRVFGLDIRCGTLKPDLFDRGEFDCVVLRHAIEHVAEPAAMLDEIARTLKPGGLLFIVTPNTSSLDRAIFGRYWHDYDVPRHVFVYSATNLALLLQRHGFGLVAIRHSIVPNNYIGSVERLCRGQARLRRAAGFFRFQNPLTWPLFMPFAALGALIRRSGRIEMLARAPCLR
ncbi:class I SAM-dependent methyltransferase [Candidatus Sumerlaeota bacterium]|nr:class I SAM-dependent methyltransferase [Candidatus Sumerlaeota bacterium]